jgi:hypothetical protein
MTAYNKRNLNIMISAFSIILMPFLGFIFSMLSLLKGRSNKFNYLLISLFVFIFFINIPAFSDLYRHYIVFSTSTGDEVLELFEGKIDFVMPFTMYLTSALGLPFYIIPAIYTALSVYLALKATGVVISHTNKGISNNAFIALHVITLFIAPLFVIALGLRFGLGCYIAIYACTMYSLKEISGCKFLLLALIAVFTHFALFSLILSCLISRVIFISKRRALLYGIIAFLLSGTIIPIVISKITFMNLNVYAEVYLSGVFGSFANKNINGLINYGAQFTPFMIFFVYFIIHKQPQKNKFNSMCGMVIIMLALMSVAPVALGRLIVPVTHFLFFNYILAQRSYLRVRHFFLSTTFLYLMIYFIFENVYIQRRPIMLGEMWEALYTPPFIHSFSLNSRFKDHLKQINSSNGEWIGHETDGS